ncbi:MAG: MarR family winged helix-turn-helix transcriptional regulator [Microbacteriaceae bacterium]
MNPALTSLLQDLLVSAHRLTRMAAQTTGNSTPAAVWHTLSILATDGPMRIGDLAKAGRVSQPTMTKLLQHLVAEELVYRIADVDDSRAWLIANTRKGDDALEDWRTQLATALGPVFADLNRKEIGTLEDAAALLRTRMTTQRKAA